MIVTLECDAVIATLQDNDSKGPRILTWEEDSEDRPAIKSVYSKESGYGVIEKDVYTTTPITITLRCRVSSTQKSILKTLQSTQNPSNIVLLKRDSITYKSVWIDDVDLSWEGNEDFNNIWVITMKLMVI